MDIILKWIISTTIYYLSKYFFLKNGPNFNDIKTRQYILN